MQKATHVLTATDKTRGRVPCRVFPIQNQKIDKGCGSSSSRSTGWIVTLVDFGGGLVNPFGTPTISNSHEIPYITSPPLFVEVDFLKFESWAQYRKVL